MLAPVAGAAVIGTAGSGVSQMRMVSRTLAGLIPVDAPALWNASYTFDDATSRSTLRYSRLLDPGTGDTDKALSVASPPGPLSGWIWARGVIAVSKLRVGPPSLAR